MLVFSLADAGRWQRRLPFPRAQIKDGEWDGSAEGRASAKQHPDWNDRADGKLLSAAGWSVPGRAFSLTLPLLQITELCFIVVLPVAQHI